MVGAGGGAPTLDDMIMNSIGVPGAQAASDSLLPQLGMPPPHTRLSYQLNAGRRRLCVCVQTPDRHLTYE